MQQHSELVAAQTRDHAALADRLDEARRHLLEQPVADDMAECVVDRLESVKVEDRH